MTVVYTFETECEYEAGRLMKSEKMALALWKINQALDEDKPFTQEQFNIIVEQLDVNPYDLLE